MARVLKRINSSKEIVSDLIEEEEGVQKRKQ